MSTGLEVDGTEQANGFTQGNGAAGLMPPQLPQLSGALAERTRPRVVPVRGLAPRAPWETRYAGLVIGTDVLSVLVSIVLYGFWGSADFTSAIFLQLGIPTLLLMILFLAVCRAWEPVILGQGSEEFTRLLRAVVTSGVVLGLAGLALKWTVVRPWAFGVIPVAGLLMALGRMVLRKDLHRRRRRGQCTRTVLAVGSDEAVADLIARTRRARHHGWVVTGVCTPSAGRPDQEGGVIDVPVVGDLNFPAEAVRTGAYHVVSVAQAPGWSSKQLHQLAWDLEGTGVELVVDPGLMEIAGPRLHVAAVDGLPLLRLTEPAFTGLPRVIKSVTDRLAAGLGLFLLAPLLLGIAIAVRLDGGPVFFKQVRIGRHGKPFTMIKFRSMVVEAEQRRMHLLDANQGAGPLFKLKFDPRVTRVGTWLRRYSFDELPQLINILTGSMSLVGPRPPLPEEVATYEREARRKFLVKPGLTGLWQVSGRSDLSWAESVRLDLRYVENWSLALDAEIMWKTVGAIISPNGAY